MKILIGHFLAASGPVIGDRLKNLGAPAGGFKALDGRFDERQMNRAFGRRSAAPA